MDLEEAVQAMEECLQYLSAIARECARAARLPPSPPDPAREDLYALTILGAVHEMAEGVIEERRVGRVSNATRLARHLYEHDLESSWVLTEPRPRLRRRVAEEFRNGFERLPTGAVVDSESSWMRDYLDEVRAEMPRDEIERDGRLMPSSRSMARSMGALEECDRAYRLLSWTSRPGFLAAYRSFRLNFHEGQIRIEAGGDLQAHFVPLSQGAHSVGRCTARLAPLVGVTPHDELTELQLQAAALADEFG